MLPAYGEVNIKYYDWAELILTLDRHALGPEIKKDTKIDSIVLAGNPPFIRQVHVEATTTIIPVFPLELIGLFHPMMLPILTLPWILLGSYARISLPRPRIIFGYPLISA